MLRGFSGVRDINRSWWSPMIRGIVAVLFGLVALILPGLTLRVLIALFGAYVLLDGIFAIVAALQAIQARRSFVWSLVEGIASITVGILTFFWPGLTALVLLYFVAFWAILTGVVEIVAAVELRRIIQGEWLLLLSGVLSIVFGVVLVLFPGAGALSLIWLIGIYAIVFGVLLIDLSLRLRSVRDERAQRMTPAF